ncbi:MAG TPA: nuclear transport factor 2 family protein [Terriglobales bacterium]|nr:nuclear transport factor 2 family protein [Terriglobales bacterium]
MSRSAKSSVGFDRSPLAALRKSWVEAMINDAIGEAVTLVTDDVVAIHGDGHCSCGKDELRRYLQHRLGLWDVQRTTLSSEVIVREHWAVEVDDVESTRAAIGSDDTPIASQFNTVFVFRQQPDAKSRESSNYQVKA